MNKYQRTGNLVSRKFYQFLFPSILSCFAVTLNEFVDGIIVSHLLGTTAMTMVNMGYPIMMVFGTFFSFLGIGGSNEYAECSGRQDTKKARRIVCFALVLSLVTACAFVIAGLVFSVPIASVLCSDQYLLSEFLSYVRILVLSGILIIPLQVLVRFFPAMGHPETATLVNAATNIVNLIMDYVLIHFCNTGLKGAALATLVGYITGSILVLFLCLRGKLEIKLSPFGKEEWAGLPSTLARGAASAFTYLAFSIRVTFFNSLAMDLSGIDGVNVFSLCMQSLSICSFIIEGIIASMMPIVATLEGQDDSNGLRFFLRTVLRVQLIASVTITGSMELFPQMILSMYNVQGALALPAIKGLRLFVPMFIFRSSVTIFIYYFQASSRRKYAMLISMIDGFAGLIPLALLLTSLLGITGIWLSFPLMSLLTLAGIVICNLIIVGRSNGHYQGVLLTKHEEKDIPVYDATICLNESDITENSRLLQEFCRQEMPEQKMSGLIAVASEEIGIYTMKQKGKNDLDEIDLLVKFFPDQTIMDVRSIGKPFDVMSSQEEEFSNIDTLRRLASTLDYNYAVGMNLTRIRIFNS